MKVRLLIRKNLEVQGRMKTCRVGQLVDIGKALAMKWVAAGEAEVIKGTTSHEFVQAVNTIMLRKPSTLMTDMRRFWFNNEPGTFPLRGRAVTREEIHLYGGPNPEFNECPFCQRSEWLSRLEQFDLFEAHRGCKTASMASRYCKYQGDDQWTHYHQCFWYAAYVDPDEELSSPRCLMYQSRKGYDFVWAHSCDPHTSVWLRQFAQAGPFDVIHIPARIDAARYDWCVAINDGFTDIPDRPALPVALYGHDLWKRREQRQLMLDIWKPEFLWTPFAAPWRANFDIPDETEVVFRPVPASMFYNRVNLDRKDLDLLLVGSDTSAIYAPRARLGKQVQDLPERYSVRAHTPGGAARARWPGSNRLGKMPFANAYSDLLGTAKFVIFGPIDDQPQPVFFKYYEVLGSGAIPVMPNAPDLALLGVKPWVHFIPLDHVWGNNENLSHVLDDYELHRPVAERAAGWFRANADRLLFDGFGDLVQKATEEKYERRLK